MPGRLALCEPGVGARRSGLLPPRQTALGCSLGPARRCAARRNGQLARGRPLRSAPGNSVSPLDELVDVDYDIDAAESESPPPPLPKTALEMLAAMLTQVAAADTEAAAPGSEANPAPGAPEANAYRPLHFCTNCCRPLAAPGATCGGCGHHPSRDAEVLGDPHAWRDAYAAQLAAQQQQQQQQGAAQAQQRGQQRGRRSQDVLLASDPAMLLHRSSLPPCPARPERLQAIMSRLHTSGLLARCRLLPCEPAADADLHRVHSASLVAAVRGMGSTASGGGGGGGGVSGALAAAVAEAVAAAAAAAADASPAAGAAAGAAAEPGLPGAQAAAAAEPPAPSPLAPLPPAPALPAVVPPSSLSHWSDAPPPDTLSADTLYNAHTAHAALLAAGAAAEVGRALASGAAGGAVAVVRPPGAQASREVSRGGCYLNNVAVAAAAARAAGAGRVLIVDWDVHHGGGTQEIFADEPLVTTLSMHRYDSEVYPGSGAVDDVGEGAAAGSSVNVAFTGGGLTDGDLLAAALHVVLPLAHALRPDVVLVAAGFGALKGDPIGGCACSPAAFGHLTHLLRGVAPVGLLLEGGYALGATAEAVEACVRVLLGEAPPPLPPPGAAATTSGGWVGVMNAMQIQSQHHPVLKPLSFNGWIEAINRQQSTGAAAADGGDTGGAMAAEEDDEYTDAGADDSAAAWSAALRGDSNAGGGQASGSMRMSMGARGGQQQQHDHHLYGNGYDDEEEEVAVEEGVAYGADGEAGRARAHAARMRPGVDPAEVLDALFGFNGSAGGGASDGASGGSDGASAGGGEVVAGSVGGGSSSGGGGAGEERSSGGGGLGGVRH